MDEGQIVDDLIVPCAIYKTCVIKVAHLVTYNSILVNYITFDEKAQAVMNKIL